MTDTPNLSQRLASMDISSMTSLDVAAALGCSQSRAGVLLSRDGRPYRKIPHAERQYHRPLADAAGFPVPLRGDPEAHWKRRLKGREFTDHPKAAPATAFIRLPPPALHHTAGGVGW